YGASTSAALAPSEPSTTTAVGLPGSAPAPQQRRPGHARWGRGRCRSLPSPSRSRSHPPQPAPPTPPTPSPPPDGSSATASQPTSESRTPTRLDSPADPHSGPRRSPLCLALLGDLGEPVPGRRGRADPPGDPPHDGQVRGWPP